MYYGMALHVPGVHVLVLLTYMTMHNVHDSQSSTPISYNCSHAASSGHGCRPSTSSLVISISPPLDLMFVCI